MCLSVKGENHMEHKMKIDPSKVEKSKTVSLRFSVIFYRDPYYQEGCSVDNVGGILNPILAKPCHSTLLPIC